MVKQDFTEKIKLIGVKKKLTSFLNTCLYGLKFKFCLLLQTVLIPMVESLAAGNFSSQPHRVISEGKKRFIFPLTPTPGTHPSFYWQSPRMTALTGLPLVMVLPQWPITEPGVYDSTIDLAWTTCFCSLGSQFAVTGSPNRVHVPGVREEQFLCQKETL